MMTIEQKIESLKKPIKLMSRIMDNMTGGYYESQDAMRRAIRDLDCELFDLELSLHPATNEIAIAA
jgi:hypothetical protein